MIANNFIEIYSLVFSWNIYGAIWKVLIGTGLALIPFIVIIVQGLMRYNDIRGVRGTVQGIELKLLSMILIMSLCVIPVPIRGGQSLATVKYTLEVPDCQVRANAVLNTEGDGDNTGEIYDDAFAGLAGTIVDMPIAWYGINYISAAITHAAIRSMNCVNNYELMLLRLSEVRIQDPVVRERIQEFGEACYKKTLARYNENPIAIPPDVSAVDDIDWIGSRIFQNAVDEYYRHEEAYMTNMERFGFTRNEVDRSTDFAAPDTAGANPTCLEVWEGEAFGVNPAPGLRQVILDSIPVDEVGNITDDWTDWGHLVFTEAALDPRDSADILIKMILEADSLNLDTSTDVSLGNEFDTDRTWSKRMLNTISEVMGNVAGSKQFFEINALKQMSKVAGPIVLAIVQMMIIFAAPFVMTLTGYKFESFFGLALTYFTFEFINVIWATAFWFDNHILDVYFSRSEGVLDTYTNTMIALIVSAGNVFLMPMLWLGMMAYAGPGMVRGLAASGGGTGSGPGGNIGSGGAGMTGTGLAAGYSKLRSARNASSAAKSGGSGSSGKSGGSRGRR
ncbi:hypothetical protein DOK_11831 [gamma proteobacterium BDW918]|nr:hypothetical protein DOK_11831 [gamma proteobacterium BDW918]